MTEEQEEEAERKEEARMKTLKGYRPRERDSYEDMTAKDWMGGEAVWRDEKPVKQSVIAFGKTLSVISNAEIPALVDKEFVGQYEKASGPKVAGAEQLFNSSQYRGKLYSASSISFYQLMQEIGSSSEIEVMRLVQAYEKAKNEEAFIEEAKETLAYSEMLAKKAYDTLEQHKSELKELEPSDMLKVETAQGMFMAQFVSASPFQRYMILKSDIRKGASEYIVVSREKFFGPDMVVSVVEKVKGPTDRIRSGKRVSSSLDMQIRDFILDTDVNSGSPLGDFLDVDEEVKDFKSALKKSSSLEDFIEKMRSFTLNYPEDELRWFWEEYESEAWGSKRGEGPKGSIRSNTDQLQRIYKSWADGYDSGSGDDDYAAYFEEHASEIADEMGRVEGRKVSEEKALKAMLDYYEERGMGT
jgi:hypothetical protein